MNTEMIDYQKKLKQNIQILIENNRLEDAKELLNQYENIVKNDVEVYSMKAIIAIMEEKMDEAESFLLKGFNKDSNNFDILYNLGFLYQSKKENELAIEYYKKAFQNAKNEEDTDTIYTILKDLGIKENKNQLLDSRKGHDIKYNATSEKGNDKVNIQEQMEVYKKQFKENIELLIEQGLLEDAKDMVDEYEKIVKDDVNIYSIKGVISMIEGNMDKAEDILLKALDMQPFNNDILYNLAYLYEIQEKYITAYRYYKKLDRVVNEEIKEEIVNKIKELEKMKKVVEYNKRKKVLFIAHIFPPLGGSGVQRSLKFVKYLRNFGWEPVVVTVGKTRYPLKDESMVSEIPDEIQIIKVDEAQNIDNKYANQLIQLYSGLIRDQELMNKYVKELGKSQQNLNQLILLPDMYMLWATEVLNKLEDKVDFNDIDIIYTTSGPYSDHIIGYYLKSMYYKPWIADFRDEWTNNPYAIYNKDNILYKMHFAMEKNIVNLADKVITVTPLSSENYKRIFNLEESKVKTITNGYDEEDFVDLERQNKKNQKFTIIHNGLLYFIRTPETIMKALKKLIENEDVDRRKIKLTFGWTENVDQWIKLRNELGLEDIVEFLDYMRHTDSLKEANKADILLLIVGTGEKNKATYPGKLFEYLRLCKPILALSPQGSEVEELIQSTNRGYNAGYNDIESIAKYILEFYQLWEKNTLSKLTIDDKISKYERKELTKQLTQVFLEVGNQYKSIKFIDNIHENGFTEKTSYFYNELFKSGGLNKSYHKHYSQSHYYETWLKALGLIKRIQNPNILDIGCGPGQFANLLFDNNITKYKGLDFSPEAIKIAQNQNKEYSDLFKLDNAYTTNLLNEDYNTVIIFEFLEHIDDDLKILSRIKEGTNILFSVPNFYSEGHVRWFHSKQEAFERYKNYIDIEDIFVFLVGGTNKIFLGQGRIKNRSNVEA